LKPGRFCALVGAGLIAGCADDGGRSGGGASGAPPAQEQRSATAAAPAALRVVKAAPDGAGLRLALSAPVDPASARSGDAVAAFVDDDPNPGGTFSRLPGKVEVLPDGSGVVFRPDADPPAGHEVRILLTRDLSSAGGAPLEPCGPSAAISFAADVPGAVHEVRYRAAATATAAATAALGAGDDHGDDAGSATSAGAGPTAGAIGVANDVDWFAVDLAAADYVLRTETTGDTVLTLYGADGTSELARNDDDPAGGLASRIEHTAAAGRHYLRVAGYGSRTPGYTLHVEGPAGGGGAPPAPGDDHGDDAAGASWLAAGSSSAGAIEVDGDVDWFRLRLDGGERYALRTRTSGDTVLTLHAADGTTQVDRNDDDPAGGLHSRLTVAPGSDATYYAEVAGFGSSTPGYDLSLRRLAAAPAGPDPTRFELKPGTDPWHIDFELRRAAFDRDLDAHGLLAGDAATDDLVRRLVIDHVLSFLSEKYRRAPDGEAVPGTSWRISFTSEDPPGSPGRSYSREAVGGRHEDRDSTLGVSLLDYGNRRAEDNARAGELGIFSAVIWGRDSYLSPGLRASDARYLDGSYRLGDGSSADDRRFRRVRAVAADWGHALSVVTAHEVGHSVGLDHEESDRRGVMQATISRWVLSDRDTHFSTPSASILDRNLGHD